MHALKGGAKLSISAGGRDVAMLTPATHHRKYNLGTCAKVMLSLFRSGIAAEPPQNQI